MQAIRHNEYTIIATAFMGDDDKWIGEAELISTKDNPINVQNPIVFDNGTFDSREEAEDFAMHGAQFFIDTQLQDSGLE